MWERRGSSPERICAQRILKVAPWSKVCSPGWVPDDGKLLRLDGALFRSRAKYRAGAVVKHEVAIGLFFN